MIKYYPKSYVMSDNLKAFFSIVTGDEKTQQLLYNTKKISDVAVIARTLGCNIQAAEVLQAQAGRVLAILDEQTEDVERLISGVKPKTGAQWGRGGGGFLDRAGYWLMELPNPQIPSQDAKEIHRLTEQVKHDLSLKDKLLKAKTFNDVAAVCHTFGFDLTATQLLSFQAQKILALTPEQAEYVANH
jgi:hypothetical protein